MPAARLPGGEGRKQVLTELPRWPVGRTARVAKLTAGGLLRRRLLDLGFVPGVEVMVLRRAPFGDPTAYLVRGAVVALREEEAVHILVRE